MTRIAVLPRRLLDAEDVEARAASGVSELRVMGHEDEIFSFAPQPIERCGKVNGIESADDDGHSLRRKADDIICHVDELECLERLHQCISIERNLLEMTRRDSLAVDCTAALNME